MGKILITTGLCIVAVGIIIYLFGDKVGWFGNLFGDIKIVKSNFGVYFPITSMIIISIVLTLILNFFSRFFQ
jgi:hypothetical protein